MDKHLYFLHKDGRKIAFRDYGHIENKRVVICVHALTRNSTDYHHLAQALANDYRVIIPDIAGRGHSEPLQNIDHYNYSVYTQDILDLVEYLKIQESYWIGTSMGGIIGMFFNERRPGFIKKLILNDIAPEISLKATQQINDHFKLLPEKFDNYQEIARSLKHTYGLFGMKNNSDWEFFIENSIIRHTDGSFSFNYDKNILNTINQEYSENLQMRGGGGMWHLIRDLDAPLMLIKGQFSTILTYEIVNKFKALKPNLFLLKVQSVGHAPHFMDPTLIKITKEWLDNSSEDREKTMSFK